MGRGWIQRLSLLGLLLCCSHGGAWAKQAVPPVLQVYQVVLLQPEAEISARVSDVAAMADYVKALEHAVEQAAKTEPRAQPSSGFVIIAVKPGRQAQVWLDLYPQPRARILQRIQKQSQAVPALAVNDGLVLFALKVGLWQGREPFAAVPSPPEWRVLAQQAGRTMTLPELAEAAWPH